MIVQSKSPMHSVPFLHHPLSMFVSLLFNVNILRACSDFICLRLHQPRILISDDDDSNIQCDIVAVINTVSYALYQCFSTFLICGTLSWLLNNLVPLLATIY